MAIRFDTSERIIMRGLANGENGVFAQDNLADGLKFAAKAALATMIRQKSNILIVSHDINDAYTLQQNLPKRHKARGFYRISDYLRQQIHTRRGIIRTVSAEQINQRPNFYDKAPAPGWDLLILLDVHPFTVRNPARFDLSDLTRLTIVGDRFNSIDYNPDGTLVTAFPVRASNREFARQRGRNV